MSYLDWHCPESGNIYLMVHSYTLTELDLSNVDVRASQDGDPCVEVLI